MKWYKFNYIGFAIFFTLALCSCATEKVPQNIVIQGHLSQGRKLGDAGRLYEAINEFEKVLEIAPNNVDAFNNLGVAYFRLKNFEKSLFYHSKAVDTNPSNPRIYFNRGLLLGKYMYEDAKAIEDYSKAIELDHFFVRAYWNRALAYGFLKEYEKAIADYNKVEELSPRSIRGFLKYRAKSYFELGNTDAALRDIKKAKMLGEKLDDEFIAKVENAAQTKK